MTIDTASCDNSFPDTIFGHIFNAPAAVTDTVSLALHYAITISINVTSLPLLTKTVDTAVCANSFPATIFGHVFNAPASITDTVSSAAGCDTDRKINVK